MKQGTLNVSLFTSPDFAAGPAALSKGPGIYSPLNDCEFSDDGSVVRSIPVIFLPFCLALALWETSPNVHSDSDCYKSEPPDHKTSELRVVKAATVTYLSMDPSSIQTQMVIVGPPSLLNV